jgi:hypothetical protein
MDGHDPHSAGITFKPELMFIGSHLSRIALLCQPPDEAPHPAVSLQTLTVQDFREVKNVGQPTFSVGLRQKTGTYIFHQQQRTHHPHEAGFLPLSVIIAETLKAVFPLSFIDFEAV